MASIEKRGSGYRVKYRAPDGRQRSQSVARKADAERLNMDISPLGGEEMKKIIAEMVKTPSNILERYKKMIAP